MAEEKVQLRLGDFVFQDFEIPESIPFGAGQQTIVKHLVGGARVIDAMGVDPVDPSWSGVFFGPDALPRATRLKVMAAAGLPLDLTWHQLTYQVLIARFEPDFRRAYHIPYRISLITIQDKSSKNPTPIQTATEAIRSDLAKANTLTTSIGNPSLTAGLAPLTTAITAVSDFAKATRATLNTVLAPLATVQAQVKTLIASAENTLMNVTTVGGLLPNNPASKLVAQLSNYVNANTQQPQLLQLQAVLGRIGVNIGQVNSSVRVIQVPGGNLMDVAAKQYGDPMGYTAILAANPALKGEVKLSGITTLVIPPYTNKSDGIVQ